jgi:hypothetical protein
LIEVRCQLIAINTECLWPTKLKNSPALYLNDRPNNKQIASWRAVRRWGSCTRQRAYVDSRDFRRSL